MEITFVIYRILCSKFTVSWSGRIPQYPWLLQYHVMVLRCFYRIHRFNINSVGHCRIFTYLIILCWFRMLLIKCTALYGRKNIKIIIQIIADEWRGLLLPISKLYIIVNFFQYLFSSSLVWIYQYFHLKFIKDVFCTCIFFSISQFMFLMILYIHILLILSRLRPLVNNFIYYVEVSYTNKFIFINDIPTYNIPFLEAKENVSINILFNCFSIVFWHVCFMNMDKLT